jgi:site-specific recombinase XerD
LAINRATRLSERTRRTYRRDMERWTIPYFRPYRLAEIEPPDVRAFVGHLEAEGLWPATVRAILAPVKAMCATAVEDGAIRSNPTRDLRIGGKHHDAEDRVQ